MLFGSDAPPALPLDIVLHDMGVIEAMAAGTPTVAFDVGSTGELIGHGETGYLAAPGDSVDLARGLEALLSATASDGAMGARA